MGYKYKIWLVVMFVGCSVFVDVLYKIDNVDKVIDNCFKFNKNFFLLFYCRYEYFLFVVLL